MLPCKSGALTSAPFTIKICNEASQSGQQRRRRRESCDEPVLLRVHLSSLQCATVSYPSSLPNLSRSCPREEELCELLIQLEGARRSRRTRTGRGKSRGFRRIPSQPQHEGRSLPPHPVQSKSFVQPYPHTSHLGELRTRLISFSTPCSRSHSTTSARPAFAAMCKLVCLVEGSVFLSESRGSLFG